MTTPLPLADGFPPASLKDWESRAPDGPLTTTLEEGLEVKWLYTQADSLSGDPAGSPGSSPFVRGNRVGEPWAIRQRTAAPTRARANAEILEDLEGGATEVLLTLRSDGSSVAGVPVANADELAEVLTGVLLDLAPVALDAGPAARPAAEALLELLRRSGHPAAELRASLRLDPIGALAAEAQRDRDLIEVETKAAVELAQAVSLEFPHLHSLAVDTTGYADAGAGAVLELALATTTAIAYLRAAEAVGLDPSRLAAVLEFTLAVGPDQFLEVAKLRASRRLWSTVLGHCGVEDSRRSSHLYAQTSHRMTSSLDPPVNLLRYATATLAAAVGGADGITVGAFDEPRGVGTAAASPLGRRLARNTQLVLMEEASLHRVADPAGGSWYVEALTDQLARAAWAEVQAIERAGGILSALASGEIATRVAAARDARQQEVAHGRRALTGVNLYPLLDGDGDGLGTGLGDGHGLGGGDHAAQDAGPAGPADRTDPTPEFAPVRDGAQFEALRARAAALDPSPRILLACVGPLAAHVNVAQWAKSFFESGGIETVASGEDPESLASIVAEHHLTVAAVCTGREGDPEPVAAALRAGGIRHLYAAGADAPGAERVADGVDMVAVLSGLLDRIEADR